MTTLNNTNNTQVFTQLLANQIDKDLNVSITENGALGYKTTKNPMLDFNFKITSYRNASQEEIIDDWMKVLYAPEIDNTLKLKFSFYIRDILEGLGERKLARTIWAVYCYRFADQIVPVLHLIPEYGRWDDLLILYGINFEIDPLILEIVQNQLKVDLKNKNENKPISLLAKWMPSVNSHCKETRRSGLQWSKLLGMTERQYRKTLSALRSHINIVESNLSQKTYERINYSQVPSKASLLYQQAFCRNDGERYMEYIRALNSGDKSVKINVAATMPHEIVHQYCKKNNYDIGNSGLGWIGWGETVNEHSDKFKEVLQRKLDRFKDREDALLEAAWNGLHLNEEKLPASTLVVCDSSGSMTTKVSGSNVQAIEISNALAIYFSERLTGPYKDKFITFSSHPRMVDLSGCQSLNEKLIKCSMYDDCSNTNIEAVFDLILQTAIDNNLKQEDLPENVLILSDMEFDACLHWRSRKRSLFDIIQERYKDAGYKMPRLIFNNLCGRTNTIPVIENENGVTLMSGFSKNIAKQIMCGELDPWKNLVAILNNERYARIQ